MAKRGVVGIAGLAALGALLVGGATAEAQPIPAINCARPQTVVETTICRSPELLGLDREVSQAHAEILASVSGDLRSRLLLDQRRWRVRLGNTRSDEDIESLLGDRARYFAILKSKLTAGGAAARSRLNDDLGLCSQLAALANGRDLDSLALPSRPPTDTERGALALLGESIQGVFEVILPERPNLRYVRQPLSLGCPVPRIGAFDPTASPRHAEAPDFVAPYAQEYRDRYFSGSLSDYDIMVAVGDRPVVATVSRLGRYTTLLEARRLDAYGLRPICSFRPTAPAAMAPVATDPNAEVCRAYLADRVARLQWRKASDAEDAAFSRMDAQHRDSMPAGSAIDADLAGDGTRSTVVLATGFAPSSCSPAEVNRLARLEAAPPDSGGTIRAVQIRGHWLAHERFELFRYRDRTYVFGVEFGDGPGVYSLAGKEAERVCAVTVRPQVGVDQVYLLD